MELKWILQLAGVLLGLLYLYLEYKAHIALWAVSMIMPVVHGCLYFQSGLYADAGMQVYYVSAAVYGWVCWRKGNRHTGATRSIGHTPPAQVPRLLAVLAAAYALLAWLLVTFTDSQVPYWDALTTALSIVALWMLSRKWMEQWLVWLVVDAVTVGLYAYKQLPLTAALYVVYCVLAVVGYFHWKKLSISGN
ncbi:MAG: nicotinamide mononucleotide transporter [Paludibacteraceae bacterium]|nr:nicotinamide mononucleotide transporter [Paludibacteraceae bacterium]